MKQILDVSIILLIFLIGFTIIPNMVLVNADG
jgi:hypothetical protein